MPIDDLPDSEIADELRLARRVAAQADARTAELIAASLGRGIPEADGFGSAAAWVISVTDDPPAVCRTQVRVARSLRHMPETWEAFSRGELSEPRVRLLADARDFSPDIFSRDEPLLVSQARSLSSRVFPLALSHWRRLADPDGALADAGKAFERRRLCVSAIWAGMVRLDGDLDPESGEVVIKAIGSLAAPWALDREDTRTPQQRRADALVEICRRHLDSGAFPEQGGVKPHLALTVSLEALQGSSLVDLEAGPITAESARRLGCDATVSRIVSGPGREPLEVGRATRTVPAGLRRALDLRDRGCTHPGCDVRAQWCDAHHIVHWAHGGRTDLENLRLLCRRHHGWAHDHSTCRKRE